jgi:hypothetical protein
MPRKSRQKTPAILGVQLQLGRGDSQNDGAVKLIVASAARYFHFSQSCSRVRRWVKWTRTDLGNKHMRIARLVCRLALPAAALLYGLHQAGAQGMGTPDARAACTPDAMRLCSEYVPDANRVRSCMMSKRSQLSHACRAAMAASHEMYRRRDRAYCQRHPRHCH